ncbi:CCA tRNA nucleotidyltransferase [Aquibium sp. ELW1220]|uniref:CCA tRNA nucleotidyltransferase n=1 Tax=Aquibium sp. ELW1220 TaxID=2976766 RepID=UPI0025B159D4|nr:CCA tRNA nucleotidyltransferase [Aquibium sp. ELW1220]MDN2579404.1 CCA tRNA nucleotidyltransferase [Aquibium sp. ELW1220]
MSTVSIADRASWLKDESLQRLLSVLSDGGEEARIAGGAVRNALLGEDAGDIDIATTTLPDDTIARAERAGFKAVPTGYEHGTITVVAAGIPHEVTTLRADVETDGRRAKVRYGRDWKQDAERRDFTINALYSTANGTVIDLVGGLADIETRTLRFIGDPEDRIREDYLRILRFFRFFARYGAGRPDAAGLKACARLKEGLDGLSAERVWMELKKLLSAADPSRALLWMRQSGVLTRVLPESEKWGIDAVHGLIAAERDLGWPPDPLLRLASMVPPDPVRVGALALRLRAANAERDRLTAWAAAPSIAPAMGEGDLARLAYRAGREGIADRVTLALAGARARAAADDKAMLEAGGYFRLRRFLAGWTPPKFPLAGADLIAIGVPAGPKMGNLLRDLEEAWVDAGFTPDHAGLLEKAESLKNQYL